MKLRPPMPESHFQPAKRVLQSLFLSMFLVIAPDAAVACQPCAAYSATDLHGFAEHRMTLSLSEVYTKYQHASGPSRLRSGEILREYSTTEFAFAYDIHPRFTVQASLPVLYRGFFEFRDFRRREDTDAGIGDAAVLAQFVPLLSTKLDTTFYWAVYSGIKLPTGESDSLGETSAAELAVAERSHPRDRLAHHVSGASGVQGRGPTLGSGSFDFPFGSKIFLRYKRLFLFGSFQYTLRTEGDFDYHFADDLSWNIGPAAYLYLGGHDLSIALRAVFSGEDKGNDARNGALLPGTAIENVFLGPELLFTALGRYTAEVAVDLPISTAGDAAQEPSYRLRAALGYRF